MIDKKKSILNFSGFTIIEVLITILISSIVITTAFYVYNNISLYSIQYNKTNEKLLSLRRLMFMLQFEFDKSKIIRVNDNRVIFVSDKVDKVDEVVFYSDCCVFISDYISDTIYVNIYKTEYNYNSKSIIEGPINELKIQVQFDEPNTLSKMVFFKKYPVFQNSINK